MRGSTMEEVGDRFDGDLLGDDPRAAASEAAAAAISVVAETLPTAGKVHLSYGDEDMAEYVAQLTADHLIHGWDLAVATGGDTALDDDLVVARRRVVRRARGAVPLRRRHRRRGSRLRRRAVAAARPLRPRPPVGACLTDLGGRTAPCLSGRVSSWAYAAE